jgi:hypothetical protein
MENSAREWDASLAISATQLSRHTRAADPAKALSSRPLTFTLCCVIDAHPRFYVELILWILCLKRWLPRDRYKPIVYFVDSAPQDLLEWLRFAEVDTRRMVSLVEGSPHCNKIAPFQDRYETDCTIVCDADLYFIDDPFCLFTSWRFRAPPNNHSNPPPAIFSEVLAASGLGRPYRPSMAVCKGLSGHRETHINNICGSIVLVPSRCSDDVAQVWRRWALWLTNNRHLLDRWRVHVDQVAFALTMEELGEDVDFLPPQVNTILHILSEVEKPFAFHLSTGHIPKFPERFNVDKTLSREGLSQGAATAVGRLNDCITEAVEIIRRLPSTKDHLEKFLNPSWTR